MAHGYLGEGYGTHGEIDPDRDEREWRERGRFDREPERDWRDRESGMMFGRDRDERDERDERNERSERERGGSHYGREHGYGGFQGDYSRGGERQGGFGGYGDYREGRRSFSAHPDDHYRSWRERHIAELDRDYHDYCREREHQFHQDFDSWRRQRGHGNQQPLRTGMTQTGLSADPTGMTEAEGEMELTTPVGSDPMASATVGSQSGGRGRGKKE